jgi:hypothetical protein
MSVTIYYNRYKATWRSITLSGEIVYAGPDAYLSDDNTYYYWVSSGNLKPYALTASTSKSIAAVYLSKVSSSITPYLGTGTSPGFNDTTYALTSVYNKYTMTTDSYYLFDNTFAISSTDSLCIGDGATADVFVSPNTYINEAFIFLNKISSATSGISREIDITLARPAYSVQRYNGRLTNKVLSTSTPLRSFAVSMNIRNNDMIMLHNAMYEKCLIILPDVGPILGIISSDIINTFSNRYITVAEFTVSEVL